MIHNWCDGQHLHGFGRPGELLLTKQSQLANGCVLVRNLHESRQGKICFPLVRPIAPSSRTPAQLGEVDLQQCRMSTLHANIYPEQVHWSYSTRQKVSHNVVLCCKKAIRYTRVQHWGWDAQTGSCQRGAGTDCRQSLPSCTSIQNIALLASTRHWKPLVANSK